MTLVPHTSLEDETLKKTAQTIIDSEPTTTHVYVNPNTGFMQRFENLGWGFGGMLRMDVPKCTPKMLRENPKRCQPIKGAGVSRRCPNVDRGCQFFFNFQKFLQCYNKFEHLGEEAAVDKCGFFLNGVPPSVQNWYNQCREEGDWLGIKSNWMPKGEEDDDDDE